MRLGKNLRAAKRSEEHSRSTGGPAALPRERLWQVEVNDRYQRVVDLLISFATGSLVLPPLFLRDFLGIKDEPVALFLDIWAYTSLIGLACTILFGVLFHYVSAKWVKQAYHQSVRLLGPHLEGMLDWLFWLTALSFTVGIACFVKFAINS